MFVSETEDTITFESVELDKVLRILITSHLDDN